MNKAGLDTSYLVPLLCVWHEHHGRTIADYESRRRSKTQFVIAVHALLETYAVLTRMPPPYRLAPQQAVHLLEQNFRKTVSCAGLDPDDCWPALKDFGDRGLAGGRVYDAMIARCCAQAGAGALLTWNARDFTSVTPPNLQIVQPANGV